ncbi:MAG: hypothetical protein ACI828_000546 [Flavobacteriales bacterium]|jgi:hypothetical protein
MKKSVLAILLFLALGNLHAQQKRDLKEVDLDAMLDETQFASDHEDYVDLIWWIPMEYWKAVYAQDSSIPIDEAKEMTALLENYDIVAAVRGKIGYFGGVTFQDEVSIRKDLIFEYDGITYDPMDNNDIDADLKSFIDIMRPMFSNMMGNMGENLYFVVYQDGASESAIIDPYSDKKLTLTLSDFSDNLQFPLSSLLQPKKCPKDEALFNGKWSYCPHHGDALTLQN